MTEESRNPGRALYVDLMRPDLIVLSASALVIGVMCLVFGAALNITDAAPDLTGAVRATGDESGRWLGMAVLWFSASATLTCGMPAILSLFEDRGHRLGAAGVGVLTVGAIGTSGYAALIVFAQALGQLEGWEPGRLEGVLQDRGLAALLWVWAFGFYLGALLVAAALLVSRSTPSWVPALLLVFVVLMPFGPLLAEVGQVLRLLALALSFTGMAVAAVARTHVQEAPAQAL